MHQDVLEIASALVGLAFSEPTMFEAHEWQHEW